MEGFSGLVGISTCLFVELVALQHGLSMAWSMNIRSLLCCLDSKDVVEMVSKGFLVSHRYHNVVYSIKQWFSEDWFIKLEHTLRKGNSCDNFLPKMGATHSAEFQT